VEGDVLVVERVLREEGEGDGSLELPECVEEVIDVGEFVIVLIEGLQFLPE
jgi:3-dehydroquinate synthase class II